MWREVARLLWGLGAGRSTQLLGVPRTPYYHLPSFVLLQADCRMLSKTIQWDPSMCKRKEKRSRQYLWGWMAETRGELPLERPAPTMQKPSVTPHLRLKPFLQPTTSQINPTPWPPIVLFRSQRQFARPWLNPSASQGPPQRNKRLGSI